MVNLWELLNLNFKNIFVDFFFGNFIRAQSTSRLFPITHSPIFLLFLTFPHPSLTNDTLSLMQV